MILGEKASKHCFGTFLNPAGPLPASWFRLSVMERRLLCSYTASVTPLRALCLVNSLSSSQEA